MSQQSKNSKKSDVAKISRTKSSKCPFFSNCLKSQSDSEDSTEEKECFLNFVKAKQNLINQPSSFLKYQLPPYTPDVAPYAYFNPDVEYTLPLNKSSLCAKSFSNEPIPSDHMVASSLNYNHSLDGFGFHSQPNGFSGPHSCCNESSKSLNPLPAMSEILNQQHRPVTSHSPAGGPQSVPPSSQSADESSTASQSASYASLNGNHSTSFLHSPDPSNLDFSPADNKRLSLNEMIEIFMHSLEMSLGSQKNNSEHGSAEDEELAKLISDIVEASILNDEQEMANNVTGPIVSEEDNSDSMDAPSANSSETVYGLSPRAVLPPPGFPSLSNGPMIANDVNCDSFLDNFDFQARDFSSSCSDLKERTAEEEDLAKSLGATIRSRILNGQHDFHTPYIPDGVQPSVPPSLQNANKNSISPSHTSSNFDHSTLLSHTSELSNVNFDHAAVINWEESEEERLNDLMNKVQLK